MKRQLQLVCIFVFCLPLIVVVILINECYYLCRKDCLEPVSLCISYLRVTNLRADLFHVVIHSNEAKLITHQYSLFYSLFNQRQQMQAVNLTNIFAALLLILKSMFTLIAVLMMHFSNGFRFAHQQNLDRINFLFSINFTGGGELHILGMCFSESEQEVDNTKSIVLCE